MSANVFDLSGKVALVTGANTGIGQGIAVALAKAGADIVLTARRDPAETRELVEAEGVRAHVIMADLSSIEPCQRIVDEAVEAFGKIDILVNNAGHHPPRRRARFLGRGLGCGDGCEPQSPVLP